MGAQRGGGAAKKATARWRGGIATRRATAQWGGHGSLGGVEGARGGTGGRQQGVLAADAGGVALAGGFFDGDDAAFAVDERTGRDVEGLAFVGHHHQRAGGG